MDIVKQVISDGRKQLHKEFETSRRMSVVWYYYPRTFKKICQNIDRIREVARMQTRPFSVELTGFEGEVRFEYIKRRKNV